VPVTLIVNGTEYEADAPDEATLLELLRDGLGITGPKTGCGEGACGACTVLIGSRAVQACQVEAASAASQRIITVEGLAEDGVLHPVQQAWLETGAMQCGFCTPGWLTETAALLARVPHPDDDRIDAELAGHVCRCCTYPRIRQAVHRAAELMEHPELLEPVPAAGLSVSRPDQPAALDSPERPLDLSGKQPASFTSAMSDGLMTVVAEDTAAERGFGGPDDAWIHIGADNRITAFTGKAEAGQGTRTALSLLVAEELAVPPASVALTMADTNTSPFDLGTFGSRSMPHAAPPLRTAAAAALRLLTEAAAARFGLPVSDLTAANGVIAGPDGAPSATYGELVAGQRRAEMVPAGSEVTPASEWRIAGKAAHAAGAAAVVTGAKLFPSDLRAGGMLHGYVLHAPAAKARLQHADTAAAKAMPGVILIQDGAFIGAVAADRRTAYAAIAAVEAVWDEADEPLPDALESYLREHPIQGEGFRAAFLHETGNAAEALEGGPVRRAGHYSAAYVAHVPLEPRSALARWDAGQLSVWTGTSTPFRARRELASELGVDDDMVHVIVPDFGGGFGGKHGSVVALEAATLARAAGRPVLVQWTRADEFSSGYCRPAAFTDVDAAADEHGNLTAWSFANLNSGSPGIMTPYRIPHQHITFQPAASPLAQGSYRALAATANNFARESHMDEMAAAAGADPVDFRMRHLQDDRLAAVLSRAAAEIGWDHAGRATTSTGPAGETDADSGWRTGSGIALGREKGGRVATAATVRVGTDGELEIIRLVTVADCGAVVYPDGLANQIEGAMVMGLGPALFEQLEFRAGRILNGSMTDYRVPRLADVPVDVKVVLLDRPDQPSAGGGETPIIAVAPAIANAIFRASGVRLRSMPLVPRGRVPMPRP